MCCPPMLLILSGNTFPLPLKGAEEEKGGLFDANEFRVLLPNVAVNNVFARFGCVYLFVATHIDCDMSGRPD